VLPPDGDPFAGGLGGTEQALIHLTEALAARGHRVAVAGGAASARRLGGVAWLAPGAAEVAAITVAINDARLLGDRLGLPVVWFHNEVELVREWRKGRLPALRRHRPAAVFIGREQARLASRLLPFRTRVVIPYGLPDRVLKAAPADAIPGPSAVFTSQAYRGLDRVIGLWRSRIAPLHRLARLTAFVADGDVPAYGALAAGEPSISVRGRIGNAQLLDVLRGSRVLLAPGHRSETYCLAAAEAIAMGVPVITLGIGSLRERVDHGVTGFVCRGWREMAGRTGEVLSDDILWSRLHVAGLQTRIRNDWARAAGQWEKLADEQLGAAAA
jgi:glycosyltransferase involved in cell wall biosynthesis